jgi:serine/threonine-protein kinase
MYRQLVLIAYGAAAFDEALAEITLAQRLDPLSSIINEGVGYALLVARRYDEALAQQLSALELDPHFYKAYTAIGRVQIQKGRYEEAIEMLGKGRSLAGDTPHVLGALGQAHALAGSGSGAGAAGAISGT